MLVIVSDEELSNSSPSVASTQTTATTSVYTSQPGAEGVAQKAEEKPKVPERIYPLYNWNVVAPGTTLHYVTDLTSAENALAYFEPGLVGFDLEWKPNWRKGQKENPVALVQLANRDTILLLQLTSMRGASSTLASH